MTFRSMNPRIVITGANGQVGWELARSLLPLGGVVALDRAQADLSRPETLDAVIDELKPDVLINAAAYTAVDKAEDEEGLATKINGDATGVLAAAAKRHRALFIHYSTDYVFDGKKDSPYLERDTPSPLNAYGRSKLAGERAVQFEGGDYLVLRTTWVYASRGKNFVKTIMRLVTEREELRIVADQHGAPTGARNIADATAHILRAAQGERREGLFTSGVYHLTAGGETTWHGVASVVLEHAKRRSAPDVVKTRSVLPIATEDYPLPAPRPKNSRLNSGALNKRFGVEMPQWERGLELCLEELITTP